MKSTATLSALLALVPFIAAQGAAWSQCNGIERIGTTTCVSGTACVKLNDHYSQCVPNGAPVLSLSNPASAKRSTSFGAAISSSTLPFLGGVNLAGYDFTVKTDGSFTGSGNDPPLSQIDHFAKKGVNIFRIPFAWQLMTPTLGGTINSAFFQRYDTTVQKALSASTKPWVIIDLHNYARWNGLIINQSSGGPTNAQYASLWSQLAKKYGSNEKVIFGIMNEPHDLNSISTWKDSVQAVVNAIRTAGAKNYILIPGTGWSSAGVLPTESGPTLLTVTDPLGGKSKLLFDVHKYLDSDGSGTHTECTTDNLSVFKNLYTWLKANGRQAILSETGGGNTQSCITALGTQLAYIKAHSDAILGYTIWSAGSFKTDYELSVVPSGDQDTILWNGAVKPNLPGA